MTSQVNERAIYNFVASMDLDQEMRIHLDNALRDYIMYNWSVSTLFFLQQSILKAYRELKMQRPVRQD